MMGLCASESGVRCTIVVEVVMIKSQIKSRGQIANHSTVGFKSYGQISNQIANLLLKSQII
jgi:hypothetical protein